MTPRILISNREALGLTQLELAHALGYKHKQSVSYWETGVRGIPSHIPAKVKKLINAHIKKLSRM
jgi:transcriptional regulator with XRE-family HTH domain